MTVRWSPSTQAALNRVARVCVYGGFIYLLIGLGVGLDQVVINTGSEKDPLIRFLASALLWPVFLFWTWGHLRTGGSS